MKITAKMEKAKYAFRQILYGVILSIHIIQNLNYCHMHTYLVSGVDAEIDVYH